MVSKEEILNTLRCSMSQYPKVLAENYPHVLAKIISLWHSPEGEIYLADLLQPNGRSGGRMDRDGFPSNAWQEIFELKVLYGQPRKRG